MAEAAGVSKTTVSLVVNGQADKVGISLATRQRVEAIVREMGYVPSPAALAMATGRMSNAPEVPATAASPQPVPVVSKPVVQSPAGPPSVSPVAPIKPSPVEIRPAVVAAVSAASYPQTPIPVIPPAVEPAPVIPEIPTPTPVSEPEVSPITGIPPLPPLDTSPVTDTTPELPAQEPEPEAPLPVPAIEEPTPVATAEPVSEAFEIPEPAPAPQPEPEPSPVVEPVSPVESNPSDVVAAVPSGTEIDPTESVTTPPLPELEVVDPVETIPSLSEEHAADTAATTDEDLSGAPVVTGVPAGSVPESSDSVVLPPSASEPLPVEPEPIIPPAPTVLVEEPLPVIEPSVPVEDSASIESESPNPDSLNDQQPGDSTTPSAPADVAS